jgi:hypothetical protein
VTVAGRPNLVRETFARVLRGGCHYLVGRGPFHPSSRSGDTASG